MRIIIAIEKGVNEVLMLTLFYVHNLDFSFPFRSKNLLISCPCVRGPFNR